MALLTSSVETLNKSDLEVKRRIISSCRTHTHARTTLSFWHFVRTPPLRQENVAEVTGANSANRPLSNRWPFPVVIHTTHNPFHSPFLFPHQHRSLSLSNFIPLFTLRRILWPADKRMILSSFHSYLWWKTTRLGRASSFAASGWPMGAPTRRCGLKKPSRSRVPHE